jgi:hypothetical protein
MLSANRQALILKDREDDASQLNRLGTADSSLILAACAAANGFGITSYFNRQDSKIRRRTAAGHFSFRAAQVLAAGKLSRSSSPGSD